MCFFNIFFSLYYYFKFFTLLNDYVHFKFRTLDQNIFQNILIRENQNSNV